MRKKNLLLIGLASVLLLAPTLSATTLLRMSDKDLALDSELVAIGRVDEVASKRVGGDLMTLYTVALDEVVKGKKADVVQVAVPGGVDLSGAHPIAVTYPGAPRLYPGQELFLFLQRGLEGGYSILGFSQGAFVVSEGDDGTKRVGRNLSGVRLVDGAGARGGESSSMDLETFKRQIESYLQTTER